MYVRDHTRPELKQTMGLDPTTYDYDVFRITSEITKQVFPLTLNIDHPAFRNGLDRLYHCTQQAEAARVAGGVFGRLRQGAWCSRAWQRLCRCISFPSNRTPCRRP